jgi:hypothetical protein
MPKLDLFAKNKVMLKFTGFNPALLQLKIYTTMSMTRAQIATQLLNKMAPKGEKLAYINNREAELLKRMGGAGVDSNMALVLKVMLILVLVEDL